MDQAARETREPERREAERNRAVALRRLKGATRGGPEWCAAMEQLEDAEAKLKRQPARY